jgi:hypothetical protein
VLENVRGSASSQNILTKYICMKFSQALQEIFVILYTAMPHNYLLVKNSRSALQVEIVLRRE